MEPIEAVFRYPWLVDRAVANASYVSRLPSRRGSLLSADAQPIFLHHIPVPLAGLIR